jgi:hypothetical protein
VPDGRGHATPDSDVTGLPVDLDGAAASVQDLP